MICCLIKNNAMHILWMKMGAGFCQHMLCVIIWLLVAKLKQLFATPAAVMFWMWMCVLDVLLCRCSSNFERRADAMLFCKRWKNKDLLVDSVPLTVNQCTSALEQTCQCTSVPTFKLLNHTFLLDLDQLFLDHELTIIGGIITLASCWCCFNSTTTTHYY